MIEHFSTNLQTASNNILPAHTHTHMIRTYQMILWSDKLVLKLVVYWKTKDLVCIGKQFTARKKRRQNQREENTTKWYGWILEVYLVRFGHYARRSRRRSWWAIFNEHSLMLYWRIQVWINCQRWITISDILLAISMDEARKLVVSVSVFF